MSYIDVWNYEAIRGAAATGNLHPDYLIAAACEHVAGSDLFRASRLLRIMNELGTVEIEKALPLFRVRYGLDAVAADFSAIELTRKVLNAQHS